MKTSVALSLLVVTFLVGILADEDDHQVAIEHIKDRLEEIAYRMLKLEHDLDSRTDPVRTQKAKSLEFRIQQLEGSDCGEHYFQCGGIEPQCVSNLFVCDGRKDCRNGADEDNCEIPLKPGDKFVETKVFDHCPYFGVDYKHAEWVVKSVKPVKYFRSVVELQIESTFTLEGDGPDDAYGMVMDCTYELATHRLTSFSDVNEGWVIQFDGYNFDEGFAYPFAHAGDAICAKYYERRVHPD